MHSYFEYTAVLVSFCQYKLESWEEGTSIEGLPPSVWPVGRSLGQSLD